MLIPIQPIDIKEAPITLLFGTRLRPDLIMQNWEGAQVFDVTVRYKDGTFGAYSVPKVWSALRWSATCRRGYTTSQPADDNVGSPKARDHV